MTYISWTAFFLSISAQIFIAYKKPKGFFIWNASNVIWIYLAYLRLDYAQIAMFSIYTIINFFAWHKWVKRD